MKRLLILFFISSICFADNVRYPFPRSYKLVDSRYGCCANYHYFGFDIVYLPCYNYHGCKATSERTDCQACKNRTCDTYCPPTCPKRKALAKWVEAKNFFEAMYGEHRYFNELNRKEKVRILQLTEARKKWIKKKEEEEKQLLEKIKKK